MDEQLKQTVQRLIAEGKSDEDIQFVIDHTQSLKPNPLAGDAQAAAAQARAEEKSHGGLRLAKGVGSGLLDAVTGIPGAIWEAGKFGSDVLSQNPDKIARARGQVAETASGALTFGKRALTGDLEPEEVGHAVGTGAAFAVAPKVPRVGRAVNRGLNRQAMSVATSPVAQRALGGVIGGTVGLTHGPAAAVTGAMAGARYGSTAVKTFAELVQKATAPRARQMPNMAGGTPALKPKMTLADFLKAQSKATKAPPVQTKPSAVPKQAIAPEKLSVNVPGVSLKSLQTLGVPDLPGTVLTPAQLEAITVRLEGGQRYNAALQLGKKP